MKDILTFDDVYTTCPNCGSYVDRMDIENGTCSNCRSEEDTGYNDYDNY